MAELQSEKEMRRLAELRTHEAERVAKAAQARLLSEVASVRLQAADELQSTRSEHASNRMHTRTV